MVVVSYDDPHCGGAADALLSQTTAAAKKWSQENPSAGVSLELNAFPVSEGGERHDEVLRSALRKSSSAFIIVFVLLKGDCPQEFLAARSVCSDAPSVKLFQAVTHLSSFDDVSLVIRNLIRMTVSVLDELNASG